MKVLLIMFGMILFSVTFGMLMGNYISNIEDDNDHREGE